MISFLISFFYLIFPVFSPPAIVLPHHDLVKDTRQQFLTHIKIKKPHLDTIIIVGPDHFSSSQKNLYYSNQAWQLPDSNLPFAINLENKFSPLLELNNLLVKNDHAVYNLVSQIHSTWPDAKIFPILIGQQVPLASLDSLANVISQNCSGRCLLVASVDFSHYLPASLANVHDAFSLSLLEDQDTFSLSDAEVDSPQSLYLFIKHSKTNYAQYWQLYSHTNSGTIFHNPDTETTTHLMGYYRLGFPQKSTTKTYLYLPFKIDSTKNQTTLGPRFFYGTHHQETQTNLPNFAIATIINSSKKTEAFLPIASEGDQVNFVRGSEKQQLIKEYFDTIPSNSCIQKDYFWGTLIYESNCRASRL
jgi:AmmeMemoRadiSam system protein B